MRRNRPPENSPARRAGQPQLQVAPADQVFEGQTARPWPRGAPTADKSNASRVSGAGDATVKDPEQKPVEIFSLNTVKIGHWKDTSFGR